MNAHTEWILFALIFIALANIQRRVGVSVVAHMSLMLAGLGCAAAGLVLWWRF